MKVYISKNGKKPVHENSVYAGVFTQELTINYLQNYHAAGAHVLRVFMHWNPTIKHHDKLSELIKSNDISNIVIALAIINSIEE